MFVVTKCLELVWVFFCLLNRIHVCGDKLLGSSGVFFAFRTEPTFVVTKCLELVWHNFCRLFLYNWAHVFGDNLLGISVA